MLRSDLCDFSDAYIVVKVDIIVTSPNYAKTNKAVAFKNNPEDLDVVMSMCNLLEYSKNYKKNNRKLVELL